MYLGELPKKSLVLVVFARSGIDCKDLRSEQLRERPQSGNEQIFDSVVWNTIKFNIRVRP